MNTNQLIEESKNLAIKFQNGDQEAFISLYNLLRKFVYHTILKNGVNPADVEDVMQDVFIQIYNKIGTLENPQTMLKWTKQVTKNKSIDYLRKYKKEITTDEEDNEYIFEESQMIAPMEMPEDVMDNAETTRLVKDIIDDLPEGQRRCIYFYYFNEMKTREISETIGMSESTVKANLVKGRKKIEQEVLQLAKKHGTKLFAIPVFGVVFFAFSDEAMAAEIPATLSENVLSAVKIKCGLTATKAGSSSFSSASAGVKTGAVTSKGIIATLGAKGLAIAAISVAAVITVVCVVVMNRNSINNNITNVEETSVLALKEDFFEEEELLQDYLNKAVEFCNEANYERFKEEIDATNSGKYYATEGHAYVGSEYEYLGYAFSTDKDGKGTLIVVCKAYYKPDKWYQNFAGGSYFLGYGGKIVYLPIVFENIEKSQMLSAWEELGNTCKALNNDSGFWLAVSYLGHKEGITEEYEKEFIDGTYMYRYDVFKDIKEYCNGENVEFSDSIKNFEDYDDSEIAHCDLCGNETDSYMIASNPNIMGRVCVCSKCYSGFTRMDASVIYSDFVGMDAFGFDLDSEVYFTTNYFGGDAWIPFNKSDIELHNMEVDFI